MARTRFDGDEVSGVCSKLRRPLVAACQHGTWTVIEAVSEVELAQSHQRVGVDLKCGELAQNGVNVSRQRG